MQFNEHHPQQKVELQNQSLHAKYKQGKSLEILIMQELKNINIIQLFVLIDLRK